MDVTPEEAKAKLQPLAVAATGMPQVFLDQEQARRFFQGQELRIAARPGNRGGWITVAVMAPGMKLFAIGEDSGAGLLRPVTVFANPDG